NYQRVMGLDEVGRGCLSGPVVAAGVIFNENVTIQRIRDSKQLSAAERERLAKQIREEAAFWTIHTCKPVEIDEINILQASIKAMVKCTEEEEANPDFLLVDGNRFTSSLTPFECIVNGDNKSQSIAAASILAKVYRDRIMRGLHKEYPYYGWDTNVGYPTQAHYVGLKKYGYTVHHRKSFKLRTDKVFPGPESKS
ncbi:MAG: ribonuclease HII, partial [Balneolaceae bacterium]